MKTITVYNKKSFINVIGTFEYMREDLRINLVLKDGRISEFLIYGPPIKDIERRNCCIRDSKTKVRKIKEIDFIR